MRIGIPRGESSMPSRHLESAERARTAIRGARLTPAALRYDHTLASGVALGAARCRFTVAGRGCLPTLRVHDPGTSCPSPPREVSVETIHFVIRVDTPGTVSVHVDEYGALVDEPDVASDEGPLEITLSIAFRRLGLDQARAIAAALTRAADWVDRARS
jgi:hypothetical protein